jgi:hypothetical protein
MSTEVPNGFAQKLIDRLKPHSPFAEAIVRRQAERAGLSLTTLNDEDMEKLLPLIVAAASAFVDPSIIANLKLIYDRKRQ